MAQTPSPLWRVSALSQNNRCCPPHLSGCGCSRVDCVLAARWASARPGRAKRERRGREEDFCEGASQPEAVELGKRPVASRQRPSETNPATVWQDPCNHTPKSSLGPAPLTILHHLVGSKGNLTTKISDSAGEAGPSPGGCARQKVWSESQAGRRAHRPQFRDVCVLPGSASWQLEIQPPQEK